LKINVTTPAVVIRASKQGGVAVGTQTVQKPSDIPYYSGSYTITPGPQAQTLKTEELRMARNLTVEAIPNNYGLITWNGSFLTIT
jgi:hypothetical protein